MSITISKNSEKGTISVPSDTSTYRASFDKEISTQLEEFEKNYTTDTHGKFLDRESLDKDIEDFKKYNENRTVTLEKFIALFGEKKRKYPKAGRRLTLIASRLYMQPKDNKAIEISTNSPLYQDITLKASHITCPSTFKFKKTKNVQEFSIHSSQPTLSRSIDMLEKLGILKCVSDYYIDSFKEKKNNLAKSYIISKKALKEFLDLSGYVYANLNIEGTNRCSKDLSGCTYANLNIEGTNRCNKDILEICDEEGNVVDKLDRKKLNIHERISYKCCGDIINKCLNNQVKYRDDMTDECLYSWPDGSLRPYANICSQYPSKEKFRDALVEKYKQKNLTKSDNAIDIEIKRYAVKHNITWREDYVDEILDHRDHIEYDRNASIYALTKAFNEGSDPWERSDGDLYGVMFTNDLEKGRHFFDDKKTLRYRVKINNMSLYFSDLRKLRKFIMSCLYALKLFKDGQEKAWVKDKEAADENKLILKNTVAFHRFLKEYDRFKSILELSGNAFDTLVYAFYEKSSDDWDLAVDSIWDNVKEWYQTSRKNMVKFLGGKVYKKTIFVIEAAINLSFAEALRDAGYKVIEIYDGFYTTCLDQKFLGELYRDISRKIIKQIKENSKLLEEEIAKNSSTFIVTKGKRHYKKTRYDKETLDRLLAV